MTICCQQVKDTLRRYFEGRLSVEQRAGSVPVLEHNGMRWSSIPSDVPIPAGLITRVNGAYNNGSMYKLSVV
jgi:hypothetical protein